jgi:hypothetical protein
MRLLTASTLVFVFASSDLVALDVVPPVAGPARFAAPSPPPQHSLDLSGLFHPMPESGIGGFVPNAFGAPTPGGEPSAPTADAVCEAVAAAAAANDLPLAFFLRLIWQESRFNPDAISHAGAQGVAQFMPRVAAAMGLENPFDPVQALPMSARFLKTLRDQFGNLGLAAAAYNAGSGRVQNWLAKRSRLPKETRDYVLSITGHAPERWVKTAQNSISLKVPTRLPCRMPEAALAAAVPMPPERPPGASLAMLAFAEPEADRVSVLWRPASAAPSAPTRGTRPSARGARSTHPTQASVGARAPSAKPAGAHQQRAVIFVSRKPNAAKVRLADKTAPGFATKQTAKQAPKQVIVAKLGGKNWSARVVQVKLTIRSAPQRVRVAMAGHR